MKRAKEQDQIIGEPLPLGKKIELRIHARKLEYTFSYVVDGQITSVPQAVPTKAFTPLFTGVHLGLYAQGSTEVPCSKFTYFDHAQWTAV